MPRVLTFKTCPINSLLFFDRLDLSSKLQSSPFEPGWFSFAKHLCPWSDIHIRDLWLKTVTVAKICVSTLAKALPVVKQISCTFSWYAHIILCGLGHCTLCFIVVFLHQFLRKVAKPMPSFPSFFFIPLENSISGEMKTPIDALLFFQYENSYMSYSIKWNRISTVEKQHQAVGLT